MKKLCPFFSRLITAVPYLSHQVAHLEKSKLEAAL